MAVLPEVAEEPVGVLKVATGEGMGLLEGVATGEQTEVLEGMATQEQT